MRLIVYSLALVGFLAIGRWVTQAVVRDHGELPEDPASQTVARSALLLAYTINDDPAGRFFLPRAQVSRVYRQEGSCTLYPATADIPHLDHVAEVRFFTLYAVPVRRERVTCGGWAWGG
jgi:hypothetical protein